MSNILDQYCRSAPSRQNAVDIFRGEWSSVLPDGLESGHAELFDDPRIAFGDKSLGGFAGKRILELGPLEGGHTYALLKRFGAREVLAIEGNSRAFLKCLVVKELLGLDGARFHHGDFVKYLEQTDEKFDAILASGVLYHMQEPLKLLGLIASHTDRCLLWTHYYDPTYCGDLLRTKRIVPGAVTSYGEMSYPAVTYFYQETLAWEGFSGGNAPTSTWIGRDTLFEVLDRLGFASIEVTDDHTSHPNGPALTLALRRN